MEGSRALQPKESHLVPFHQPEGALYDDDDEIKFVFSYTLFPFLQTATRSRENKFLKSPLLEFKKKNRKVVTDITSSLLDRIMQSDSLTAAVKCRKISKKCTVSR